MNKYTVYGSEELEKKIDSLMELIAIRVVEIVGRHDLAALVLGGGYGRGEGGVLTDEKGEMRLYNDFDFFVITDNVSSSRRRAVNRQLRNLSTELSAVAGIDVDFGPAKNASGLSSIEFTMMWQELKHGHKVVYGPANILEALPDFDLNNMPHEELAKLMLNRGTGLLLARQRMRKTDLKDDDVDFIARNIWKAVMACGDAYLALHNTFSYSYRRRSELFDAFKADPEISGFYPLYKTAIEFKLKPFMPDKDKLPAMWENARVFFAQYYRYVFNVCLGAQGMTLAEIQEAFYRNPPFAANRTLRQKLKNFIINLLDVGPGKFDMNLYFKYPRTRLFIVFPALLFDNEVNQNYILLLPGVWTLNSEAGIMQSYLKLWNRFN
ncbi:MAG: hypothetical protein ACYC4Q_06540 [Victivallaceae bacterium]